MSLADFVQIPGGLHGTRDGGSGQVPSSDFNMMPIVSGGIGDYGSLFDYTVALAGIRQAASNGNVRQAEQMLSSLSKIVAGDASGGRISDAPGLAAQFNSTADFIRASVPNADANLARWNGVVAVLQGHVAALNADIAYNASQGNVTSTTAGSAADTYMGGNANSEAAYLNILQFGGGGSVVDWSKAPSALNQALGKGGVAELPGPLGFIYNNAGKIAIGVGVGAFAWFAGPSIVRKVFQVKRATE